MKPQPVQLGTRIHLAPAGAALCGAAEVGDYLLPPGPVVTWPGGLDAMDAGNIHIALTCICQACRRKYFFPPAQNARAPITD